MSSRPGGHAPETPSALAVERTVAILECLDNSRRGLNVSEVSRRLGIPKSSAHVLMVTLDRLGYIRRAPNGRDFCLGLKTLALGQRMAKVLSVSDAALPHMQSLVNEVRLSAHLSVLDRDQAVFMQKAAPPSLIQLDTYIGRRMDLHSTALGKVILAFSPRESMKHLLSKRLLAPHTPKTITSGKALHQEVSRVRRLGYAIDDEEQELGVRCVAVPILHEDTGFVAALSLAGTIEQLPLRSAENLVTRLKQCAAAIAAENVPVPPLW